MRSLWFWRGNGAKQQGVDSLYGLLRGAFGLLSGYSGSCCEFPDCFAPAADFDLSRSVFAEGIVRIIALDLPSDALRLSTFDKGMLDRAILPKGSSQNKG